MKTMLLAILFAASSVSSGLALAADYRYVSYGAPDYYDGGQEVFDLDVSSREMRSMDAIDEVFLCNEESTFHCFHNLALSFYVPKASIGIGQSWVGNGFNFSVVRKDRLMILGVSRNVWVIQCERSGRTDVFYYSDRHGLIAIKHLVKGDQRAQFFLVTSGRGFPK